MTDRGKALVCALFVAAVNVVITARQFAVEFSAYTLSIEPTFIAIPRVMAQHPGEWKWWPLWNCGLPFENTYLPFEHWVVALFSVLTRLSPARSFHIVTAGFYVLGAVAVFWMALELSRRLAASFIAALAYSCYSLSALVPRVRVDVEGALNLRRLQNLVFYSDCPHAVALALLPVAVVCFSRALNRNAAKWEILAGVVAACVVLSNAFGMVALAMALLSWLLAYRLDPWWRAPLTVGAIGMVSCCWVAPWLSPNMIRAILACAPTQGGDYRYTAASWIALAVFGGGYLMVCLVLRRFKAPAHLQFFVLLAYIPTGFVLTYYVWNIALIPQAFRYEQEMDMALMLALVFAGAAIVDRLPAAARSTVVVAVLAALACQTVHSVRYARHLIRSVDPTTLSEYKIAKWMDRNRHGERAFISGSSSFLYNVFTDNPQVHGGHDQHTVNTFIPIVGFTIYSGMNAGARDAEYSIFWLKAFGAHAISVSGPHSTERYQPFAHPHKFEGILPVLWREGDDVIYEVPSGSASLAHVIPAAAVPARRPVHGLDIAPVEAYVAALDDPRYPLATFQWKGMSEANIRATVERGQVISVQVTYAPGWEAWANGKRQTVRGDAIGQVVIEPDCTGPCEISLRYTGGTEATVTRAMSLGAMLVAAVYGWRRRRRHE